MLLAALGAVVCGCSGEPGPEGEVAITLTTEDACPRLTSWLAEPLETSVGGTIEVSASAVDRDKGDHLSFLWSASAGHFTQPRVAATHYSCGGAGTQTITVQVSDDHAPASCSDARSMTVRCD